VSAPAKVAVSPRLVEIADSVYAYEQPNGGWCVNNAGVLVDDAGVVVIDTVATEKRAHLLRESVDGLARGSRRIVVNTHAHGDHTFGNFVFGQQATLIAHERAREDMAATGLALTGLWPETDWGQIDITLPSVTVNDDLTLHLGDRIARLIHVGPAHTTGDIVVWLPAERVLFAGDVLMSQVTPFNLFGSVEGGLAAIEKLRSLRPEVVVCGHGPVAGPEVLDTCADYLRWIQRMAAQASSAGVAPLEAARQVDLGEFAGLIDPERIVGNLHRAYAERDGGELGAPLDAVAIFGEMVAYNGGRLPTCLA
jgi:cyclase